MRNILSTNLAYAKNTPPATAQDSQIIIDSYENFKNIASPALLHTVAKEYLTESMSLQNQPIIPFDFPVNSNESLTIEQLNALTAKYHAASMALQSKQNRVIDLVVKASELLRKADLHPNLVHGDKINIRHDLAVTSALLIKYLPAKEAFDQYQKTAQMFNSIINDQQATLEQKELSLKDLSKLKSKNISLADDEEIVNALLALENSNLNINQRK